MPCAVGFFLLKSNRSPKRSLIRSCFHPFIQALVLILSLNACFISRIKRMFAIVKRLFVT